MTTPIYNFSNISGFNDIINNANDIGSTILKLNKV